MAKARPKIPDLLIRDLQYKSDMRCCLCNNDEQKGQIHHIDGNPTNNKLDNLVWLCPNHHDQLESKSPLSKGWNKLTIKRYREDHYRLVEKRRQIREAKLDNEISQNENRSSGIEEVLTAQILLKIDEAEEVFYESDWDGKEDVLKSLYKYHKHSNARLVNNLFEFLWSATHMTRAGMPSKVAYQIESLVTVFYNYGTEEAHRCDLGKKAIHIGFDMMYDALVKINDFDVAIQAWSIVKYMHGKSYYFKIQELIDLIDSEYSDMRSTLKRPERDDLGPAQELVEIFIKDLENVGDLHYPWIPEELKDKFPRKKEF